MLQTFESPQIFIKDVGELHLSNQSLIILMKAVLAQGKAFRFKAKGYSMTHFIHDGDMITTEPIADRPLRQGKVIAFINPYSGHFTVHRIVVKMGSAFLVHSDGTADYSDGLITPTNVLRWVSQVERAGESIRFSLGWGRYPIAWLSRIGLLMPQLTALTAWRNKIKESLGAK